MYRPLSILMLCLVSVLHSRMALGNENQGLNITFKGFDNTMDCDTSKFSYIAGGREGLNVRVWPWRIKRYPSLEQGWPTELRFEAGHMVGGEFIPDPEVYEQLNITRMIDFREHEFDSIAQSRDEMRLMLKSLGLQYFFSFDVPRQLIGQRIWLRGIYTSPENGQLTRLVAFDVAAPCNEEALELAQGSFIAEAYIRGQFDHAINIADSLIALGWRDPRGLGWAIRAANESFRLEDKLRLMDLDFETNGRIEVYDWFGTDSEGMEMSREIYEQVRQRTVEAIQNQQQQR